VSALAVAPFFVAIAAASVALPEAAALAIVVLVLSILVARKRRLELDAFAQIALALVALMGGVVIAGRLLPKPPGLAGWAGLSLGALLAAATRLPLSTPIGGPKLTQALALVSVAATGAYPTRSYPLLVALFLGSSLLALWALEPGRARPADLGARERIGLVLGLGVAIAVSLGLARALPALADRVEAYVEGLYHPEQAGFSPRIELGSMRGMMSSTRMRARVRGPAPSRLRGIVYRRYGAGLWSAADFRTSSVVLDAERRAGDTLIEPQIPLDRLFLPLEADGIGTPAHRARADAMGILLPADGESKEPLWFHLEDAAPAGRSAPPEAEDLEVPPEIEAQLRAVAERFGIRAVTSTLGASAAGESAIAAMLAGLDRGYRYALEYERTPDRDPVLDFLTTHQEGHCEYFASAGALLLRTAGVPARVVGGFLVTEAAPVGGYYVVRDDNAHAWVEAWVSGRGWITVDPTPAAPLGAQMPATMGLAAGVADLLELALQSGLDWFRARTLEELAGAVVALLVLWSLIRWARARATRRGVRGLGPGGALELGPPLPCLERLLSALARAGHARAASETLEHFAARLAALGLDDAAELLLRYAALRYGRAGDATTVERQIDAWCRAWQAAGDRPR
jgi:transglutaminase-like putative cysteine protease